MKRRRFVTSFAPFFSMFLMLVTPAVGLGETASPPAGSPAASPAAEPPTFSVAPEGDADLSPMRLTVDAGNSVESTLTVSNDGHAQIELKTFAVGVTTGVNGGYQVLPEGNGSHGQASWVSLQSEAYILAPGDEINLSVRVTVPAGAPSGEYMAALATETTDSASVAGTDVFRVISRKVNAIVITVPGPVQAGFELGAPVLMLDDSTTTIIVPITNTGNARIRPQGTIAIESNDRNVITIPVQLNSIYAWDATTIQVAIDHVLPDGKYAVTVDLNDVATGAFATQSGIVESAPQFVATPGA